MNQVFKTLCRLALAACGLALVLPSTVGAQECDILRWGGPNRFSPTNVESPQAVQELFSSQRADIEAVLREVGWQGDADDLFAAVADGQLVEGTYETGTFFPWMTVRKKGEPTAITNRCYGGQEAFEAYTVMVESQGRRWHFAIPKMCGNIGLIGSEELPPPAAPAVCRLDVTCRDGSFVVSSAGSDGDSIEVGYVTPSGATRTYSGPFEPTEDGEHRFFVSATRNGDPSKSCREEVTSTCAPPQLTCSVDAPSQIGSGEEFTVRVSGSPAGRVESVSLDVSRDGVAQASEDLSSPYSWTGSFKKAGSYVFSAVASGSAPSSETCSATVEVLPPDTRWVWRGYGMYADDDDRSHFSDPNFIDRRDLSVDGGEGIGTTLEWLPSSRFGLEFGIEYLEHDSMLVWDTATVWAMDHDDLSLFHVKVGPNFHLTPDRAVDVYIGPFVGYAFRDDASYNDQGLSYSYDLDDEFTFGAQIGLDVPVCASGTCWTFSTSLKYMDLGVDFDDDGTGQFGPQDFNLDFQPLVFTAGVGYRF